LCGLINEDGVEVVLPKYGKIEIFQPNGLSIVWDKDCLLCGLINEDGVEFLHPSL